MNRIYKTADEDYQELLNRKCKCELIFCSNNYLYYDGEYHIQKYPIPVIDIKNSGDIGYNIDKIFFEFSFDKTIFLDIAFGYILIKFKEVELYGGSNCLIDFYDEGDSVEDIKNKIRLSNEETIMLSLYFDYNQEKIIESFFTVNEFLKS